MTKTVQLLVELTVRDLNRAEQRDAGISSEEARGAAADFGGGLIAESLAAFIQEEQREILAGTNALVTITAVTVTPQ
jgi:hypothetical protein